MLTLYISSVCRKVMGTGSSYFGMEMKVTLFDPPSNVTFRVILIHCV